MKLQDKVCLGSKFTFTTEGRRFYWLIYDSRWQHEITQAWKAKRAVFKIQGFDCKRFLTPPPASPPPPPPLFSCDNSLLLNFKETLATQANSEMSYLTVGFSGVVSLALFWIALVFCFYTGGHEARGTSGIFTPRAKKEVTVLKQSFCLNFEQRRLIATLLRCPWQSEALRLRSMPEFIQSQYTTYRQ